MRIVWKHAIRVNLITEQLWVPGTKIVHVEADPKDSWYSALIWVEHDPALSGTGRRVKLRFFGTGHEIPDGWTHVGTVVTNPFVWHLYAEYA